MISNSEYIKKLSQLEHYQEILSNEHVVTWVDRILEHIEKDRSTSSSGSTSYEFKCGKIRVETTKRSKGFVQYSKEKEDVKKKPMKVEIQITLLDKWHRPDNVNLHWIVIGLAHHFNYNIKIRTNTKYYLEGQKFKFLNIFLNGKMNQTPTANDIVTMLDLYTEMVRVEEFTIINTSRS